MQNQQKVSSGKANSRDAKKTAAVSATLAILASGPKSKDEIKAALSPQGLATSHFMDHVLPEIAHKYRTPEGRWLWKTSDMPAGLALAA